MQRFNGVLERDPAIDGWLKRHAGELGTIALQWFEVRIFQGASLPDSGRLLQGEGKFMRDVKLRSAVRLEVEVSGALVEMGFG